VIEVALAVVLLVGAGLMIRTFVVLQHVDPGIQPDRVLLVGVPLPAAKYTTLAQRNQFVQTLVERVSALPGIEAASIGHPFGGPQTSFAIVGQLPDESRRLTINLVGENHLRAFGIRLIGGRMFDAAEVRRGDRVAVINEAAIKLFAPGSSPLGARIRLDVLQHPPARTLVDPNGSAEVTVVGIMANTRNAGIKSDPVPALALPFSAIAPLQRILTVRASTDPRLQLNAVRSAVRSLDPDQPLGRPITVDEILGQETNQPRFTMAVFSSFAILGLALAAAGIYSVLSFHVLRRTHELGVRMALGAPRRHVLGLMLVMGGRLVLIGLAIGIGASLAATRLLRSQLFGVQPADPLSYVAVALVLSLVGLAACYIPARRAASVDPLVALRQE
jgi:putative ABC transport system permease protein